MVERLTNTLKGSVCDIQIIIKAPSHYFLIQDIVTYWCPEQTMKSRYLCVCCNLSFSVVCHGSQSGCARNRARNGMC